MTRRKPLDPDLYAAVVEEAKTRFAVWPSAYASGWVVKTYKERGGRYAGQGRKESTGLTKWFGEEWVDLSRPTADGSYEPCGRKRTDAPFDAAHYPKCRPLKEALRMSPDEVADAVRRKRRAEASAPGRGSRARAPKRVATYRENPEISFSVNTRKEHNPAFGKYPAEDLLVVRVEAFDGAARVAWLEAYQRSSRWSADSDSLEVTNVVVEPDYRRKKIATEMYRLAEDATGMRILSSKKQSDAGKALWASFRKAHLRNNPRANPEGIDGDALAAWCDSNESYAVLDETASAGSSWMAGACVLLAKALVARHPEAQLVGIEVDGDVQHVGALVGDVVYDALGAHDERAWARDWLAYEQLDPRTPARLVSLPPGVPASVLPDAEAPATARDVRLVARALPA